MITPEQEKWIAHLSDEEQVTIFPFDPSAGQKFEAVRARILSALGPGTQVLHRGATSLGISGQDEIDIYIPVSETDFNALLAPLAAAFGPPHSHYPLERARFVTIEGGKHVDIFLANTASQGWIDGVRFENYLVTHPEALERYRLLKEAGDGSSVREYYRRKTEFINEINTKD